MKILINGNSGNFEEFKTKFGSKNEYTFVQDIPSSHGQLSKQDFIFDCMIDEQPDNIEFYEGLDKTVVFLNTVKISLSELFFINGSVMENVFGFNGLPTFVNRDLMEISAVGDHNEKLEELMKLLGTAYTIVDDRVGMVTPRVVFMIINEAYYTVQEGTAAKPDIDNAMKLGTNYPLGPFEWCESVGIDHVYETLEAIYEDTKDERYKICPLLKKEYLTAHL